MEQQGRPYVGVAVIWVPCAIRLNVLDPVLRQQMQPVGKPELDAERVEANLLYGIHELGRRLLAVLGGEPDPTVVAAALGITLGVLGIAHGQGLPMLAMAHGAACGVLNGTVLDP